MGRCLICWAEHCRFIWIGGADSSHRRGMSCRLDGSSDQRMSVAAVSLTGVWLVQGTAAMAATRASGAAQDLRAALSDQQFVELPKGFVLACQGEDVRCGAFAVPVTWG